MAKWFVGCKTHVLSLKGDQQCTPVRHNREIILPSCILAVRGWVGIDNHTLANVRAIQYIFKACKHIHQP